MSVGPSTIVDYLKDRESQVTGDVPGWDAEEVKRQYIQDIQALYAQMKGYLADAKAMELLDWDEEAQTRVLEESKLGVYEVPKWTLWTVYSKDTINFIPMGRMRVGIKGRVDALSKFGRVQLIRPAESDGWAYEGPRGFAPLDDEGVSFLLRTLLP